LVKPISQREDLLRGELLKVTEVAWPDGIPAKRVIVNQYQLMLEEMWLTFAGGNVEMEAEDGTRTKFFVEGDKINRPRFMEDAYKLPPEVRDEWVLEVRRVNSAWQYPF
jgi:hypothetical protein